ncbi:MAG: GAF domain-containing protein, partial [Anaerolineae bacterium]|nr:GAF domain-containing protein [Anaerolineae bacterium]
GFAEQDASKRVRPQAWAGHESGYLESITITWADDELGRGPTGMAIRTGQTQIMGSMMTEPTYLPWRDSALARGYTASIALPLRPAHRDGVPYGALNIYTDAPGAFDPPEIALLEELADDLSYGLSVLETRAALSASEQRYHSLYASMNEGVALHELLYDEHGYPLDYRLLDVNAAFSDHTGISREQAVGRLASAVYGADEPPYLHIYAQVVRSGEAISFETYFPPLDRHFLISAFSPAAGQFATIFTDISARKYAEDAVHWLARFPNENPNPVLRVESDGCILFHNQAAMPLLRTWECEESQYVPETWQAIIQAALADGSSRTEEATVDGQVFALTVAPVVEEAYVNLYGLDITARKRSEVEIRRLSAFNENIIATMQEGVLLADPDGIYTYVNPAAAAIVGAEPKDIIGGTLIPYLAPGQEYSIETIMAARERGESSRYELDLLHRDGGRVTVLVSGVPRYEGDEFVGTLSVITDITLIRQALQALAESEDRFRQVVENMPVLVDAFDADRNIVMWNRECERVSGYSADEIVGNPDALRLLYPDEAYREAMLSRWLAHTEDYRDWEWELTARDGQVRTIAWSNVAQRVPIPGWDSWGVGVDVTGRVQAQLALASSQRTLETLFSNLPGLAYQCLLDDDWTMTFVSEGGLGLTGYAPDELINSRVLSFASLIHPDDRLMVRRTIHTAIADDLPFEITYRITTRDGTEKTVWEQGRLVILPDGSPRLEGLITDATAQFKAQHELRALNESLIERNRELTALYNVGHGLTATLDLGAICRLLYDAIVAPLLSAPHFNVALYDEATQMISCGFAIVDGEEVDTAQFPDIPLGEGPTSDTIRTREARIIDLRALMPGLQASGRAVQIGDERQPLSAIYVPLISGDRVVGVLNIQHYDADAFGERHLRLLSTLASQAAVAIANAQLFNAEHEQRILAEALRDTAAAITSSLNLDHVLDRILLNVDRVVPHDVAEVILADGARARIARTRGRAVTTSETVLSIDETANLHAMNVTGQPLIIPDLHEYEDWNWILSDHQHHAYLGAPILIGGATIGFFSIFNSTPGFYTPRHAEALAAFANQAAIAISNAQVYDTLTAYASEMGSLYRAVSFLLANLSTSQSVEAIAEQIVEAVTRAFGDLDCGVMLVDFETGRFMRLARTGGRAIDAELRLDGPGLVPLAARTGNLVYAPDVTAEPAYVPNLPATRSELVLPLKLSETVIIGVLDLQSQVPDAFSGQDQRALQAFANWAALAIENTQLLRQTQDALVRSETLYQVARTLITVETIPEMVQSLVEMVAEALPADQVSLLLVDRQAQAITHTAYGGPLHDQIPPVQFGELAESLIGWVLSEGRPALVAQGTTDPRESAQMQQYREQVGIGAIMIVPLRYLDDVLGVVMALNRRGQRDFTQDDVDLLAIMANQAAIKITTSRLYDQVLQHASELQQRVDERTRELRAAKEHVEAILNHASDPIVMARLDGEIRQTNPAFDRLFGYSGDESLGKVLTDLVDPAYRAAVIQAFYQVVETNSVQRLEVVARRYDGAPFTADIAFSPILDPAVDDYPHDLIGSLRDITEQKETEAALVKALEQERELGELKSRFVSMTSHEFRTPLTTIVSSAYLLERHYARMDEAKRLNHFSKIRAAVNNMTQLLDEVLIIGKAEAGRLEFVPRPLDLEALCRDILEEVQISAPPTLTLDFNIVASCRQVVMDEKLLRHILGNLLSNAVKYSPDGGTVRFTVNCDEAFTTFFVSDEGIGIPEADQKRLFEPFHRGENVATISGTGLGLAITKESVALHGGTIDFESAPGEGTRFTVVLPTKSSTEDASD